MRVPTYNDNGNKINWLVSICMFTLMFQMSGFFKLYNPHNKFVKLFPISASKRRTYQRENLGLF